MSKILLIFKLMMTFLTATFSGSHYVNNEAEIPKTNIIVNVDETYQNGSFQVSIQADNFVNVSSLELSLFYQTEYFDFNYQNTGWFINNSTCEITNPNPGEVHLYMISTEPINGNGTIWYVNLHTKKDVPLGKYPITLAVGEVYDKDLNVVNIESKVVYVNVKEGVQQYDTVYVYNSSNKSIYYEGDIIELSYYVYNGYNFSSACFEFNYDDSILELNSFEVGDSLKNVNGAVYSVNDEIKGSVIFSYASLEGINYAYSMINIKFTVLNNLDINTEVQLIVSEMYDVNLTPLNGYANDRVINIDSKENDYNLLASVGSYNSCKKNFDINVNVESNALFAAGDFVITYNSNYYVCTGVEKLMDDIMIVTNPKMDEGTIKFSFLCEDGIDGKNDIVKLKFERKEFMYSSSITINGSNFVDIDFNDLDVTYISGRISPSHNYVYYDYKSPTCTEKGWYSYRECDNCGDNNYTEISPRGHNYNWWYTTKSATCTEEGEERRDCYNCNHYETRVISPRGHNYNWWYTTKSATCAEEGEERRDCYNCNHYETRVISKKDHVYGNWYTTKTSTCTEEGEERRNCYNCNHYETRFTEALGHNLTYFTELKPTCTEDGHNAYEVCDRCNHSTYEKIPLLGHDYDIVIMDPTCIEKGYSIYTCKVCNHSYKDNFVNSLGHDLIHHKAKEPTQEENGWYEYDSCNRCDYTTIIYIPSSKHELKSEIIDPTCTEKGYTIHTCIKCNEVFKDNYVNPLGHDLIYHDEKKPTCLEKGHYKYEECKNCDYTTKVEINELGHNYSNSVIIPTCSSQGYTIHTCTRCSHSYKDTYVSTLAHEYLKEIINPTCTEKGYTIFTCANCDHTYIGAYTSNLSHDKVVEEVINPTCLNQGYTIYKCNNCNEKFHENYVAALGHNYTENIVHPTCTTNGYTEHTCTRCDSTYKDTYINATGHEYGEYVFDKEEHYKICSKCNHETEKEQHILEDNKCIVCNFKKIDITVLAGIIGGVITGIIGLIFLILKKRR